MHRLTFLNFPQANTKNLAKNLLPTGITRGIETDHPTQPKETTLKDLSEARRTLTQSSRRSK